MKCWGHSERPCWLSASLSCLPQPEDLAIKFCSAIQCPNITFHMRGKSPAWSRAKTTAQLNAFFFGARPMAISVSLPTFSLQDLGKCRTSRLLSKLYSAAQSFFIFNPHSDGNVARNICQQGIEWVWNGFAELLLDYLVLTLDTYASPCFYALLTSSLWLHTLPRTVLVKLVCFFLIFSLGS